MKKSSQPIMNPQSLCLLVVLICLPASHINNVLCQSTCSKNTPCKNGACCSAAGNCGFGPDWCGKGCLSNCNAKAECGQYADEANRECPLKVCCSKWGFCGTTSEFCQKECQSNCKEPSIPTNAKANIQRHIGYYALWSVVKGDGPDTRQCQFVKPGLLPAEAYTHIIAAFAVVRDNSLQPAKPDDVKLYGELNELKKTNPKLKVSIAVGGWAFNDPPTQHVFSNMAASKESRQAFVKSATDFLGKHGFDGLDIDWEYPVAEERGGKPADKENYVSLLKELRQAFGQKYTLTVATPLSYWYLRHFKISEMQKEVDWINVMSYDIHGVWDAQSKELGPFVQPHSNLSEIKDGLKLYMRAGVPLNKLALGFGFYARTYTLADAKCISPGCKFSGPGTKGKCTNAAGTLGYFEIEELVDKKSKREIKQGVNYDDKSTTVTLVKGNQWISYDNEKSVKAKREFAASAGIESLMSWSIDQDSKEFKLSSALTGRKITPADKKPVDFFAWHKFSCSHNAKLSKRADEGETQEEPEDISFPNAFFAENGDFTAELQSQDAQSINDGGPIVRVIRDRVRRVVRYVRARILPRHLRTGPPNTDATSQAMRRLGAPTDQAGHIVGRRLGGPQNADINFFPQNPTINMGQWRVEEGRFAQHLEQHGGELELEVMLAHRDDERLPGRPTDFFFRARGNNGFFRAGHVPNALMPGFNGCNA